MSHHPRWELPYAATAHRFPDGRTGVSHSVSLGRYATAVEAAMAYARYRTSAHKPETSGSAGRDWVPGVGWVSGAAPPPPLSRTEGRRRGSTPGTQRRGSSGARRGAIRGTETITEAARLANPELGLQHVAQCATPP